MKAKKKLLLLLVLAAVLLAALLLLVRRQPEDPGQETEAAEGTEVALCAQDPSELSEVHIENESGVVDVVRDGERLVLQGYEAYELSPVKLETLMRNLSEVTGTLVEAKASDLERYGLAKPRAVARLAGKEERTLYLGDYNESAGVWYVMRDGDEALYTVPAGKGAYLTNAPYAYLGTEFIPAYTAGEEMTERLTGVRIERPDLEEPLEIRAMEGEPQAYTSAYEITSPVQVKTSLKAMNEELGSLFGFAADAAVGKYEAQAAARYGFDEPAMVMTVEHDGTTDVFTVGGKNDAGERYLLYGGTDLLYTVSESRLAFLRVSADDLFFGIALLPDIETVAEVELALDGETYRFALRRDESGAIEEVTVAKVSETDAAAGGQTAEETPETDAAADGEMAEETPEADAAADGEMAEEASETDAAADGQTAEEMSEETPEDRSGKLDEKQFRKFFSFLLEVDVQEIHTEEEEGERRLAITYRYLDGGEDMLEEIALADGRTAGIRINGNMSFTGRLAYVEKLRTELGHLLAGEEIDTNW